MNAFDSFIDLSRLADTDYTIAVAGAGHTATLRSLQQVSAVSSIKPLLFGDEQKIRAIAKQIYFSLHSITIIDVKDHQHACDMAVAAVTSGEAQILMKGMVHTSEFAHAVLNKEAGLKTPGKLVSHLGLFDVPYLQKPLFITDAAVNIAPDYDKKCIIIENALTVLRRLGIERPKVAVIAPVEEVNPKIPSTVDAAAIVAMSRTSDLFGDAIIEGPMAIDIALSAEAGRIKGLDSQVSGDVDLLVCPNLDTANAVLKLLSFTPGSRSAGIMVGLKAPIVLTSRSDLEQTRFNSVCMAIRASYS